MEKSITQRWYDGEQFEGATFKLNDFVRIILGSKKGQCGSIISLEKIDPEPTYLVEDEKGYDSMQKESELELIK